MSIWGSVGDVFYPHACTVLLGFDRPINGRGWHINRTRREGWMESSAQANDGEVTSRESHTTVVNSPVD